MSEVDPGYLRRSRVRAVGTESIPPPLQTCCARLALLRQEMSNLFSPDLRIA
jgi:hypothetical protein